VLYQLSYLAPAGESSRTWRSPWFPHEPLLLVCLASSGKALR
jgi:hypothetical protein